MSSETFKQTLFSQFAQIGKALSNANRLELLELIAQGERNVEQLAQLSKLTFANTSQHLQHLRRAGLVSAKKKGLKVYYQLSGNDVIEMLAKIRTVAENHIAEVERLITCFLQVKDSLEPVLRAELLERARQGLVNVLDVRPSDEYLAGHIAGAINIPLNELQKRLNELDNDKEIVAYCRGPHCILAYEAVKQLREKGLSARRLEDGYPEWKSADLPIEKTQP